MHSDGTHTAKPPKLSRCLVGVAMAAGVFLVAGCAGVAPRPESPAAGEAAGIRIEAIRPAASGMMLDMRYRVVNREKAEKLLQRKTPLFLIDQATGRKLSVPSMPKVGRLRQLPTGGDGDRIYWMFFGNPGGLVKSGGKVTLLVGDARIEDLVVR